MMKQIHTLGCLTITMRLRGGLFITSMATADPIVSLGMCDKQLSDVLMGAIARFELVCACVVTFD